MDNTRKTIVFNGIDNYQSVDSLLKGKRLGLITNPTGTTKEMISTIDLLNEKYDLRVLYAPEHGVRGEAQAAATIHTQIDPLTGILAYSIYGSGENRLTSEMTRDIDLIAVDLQDVGARFYTYLYTVTNAMAACKKLGLPLLIFDRINPIGGVKVEGFVLDDAFRSAVGDFGLPARTGITLGELARYLAGTRPEQYGCDLTVVPCSGWKRDLYADETDLSWVLPSPNLATVGQAELYIGTCLFEGTNLSEGRGTTIPFEIIGAPWLKSTKVVEAMNDLHIPGVRFRSGCFTPVFHKHSNELCYAVQLMVTDRRVFPSFRTGLTLLDIIRSLHPDDFSFLSWEGKYYFDSLLGTDLYRTGEKTADELISGTSEGIREYQNKIRPYLLYQ